MVWLLLRCSRLSGPARQATTRRISPASSTTWSQTSWPTVPPRWRLGALPSSRRHSPTTPTLVRRRLRPARKSSQSLRLGSLKVRTLQLFKQIASFLRSRADLLIARCELAAREPLKNCPRRPGSRGDPARPATDAPLDPDRRTPRGRCSDLLYAARRSRASPPCPCG